MKAIKFLSILAPLAIVSCTDRLGSDVLPDDSAAVMTLEASVSQEAETKGVFDDVTAAAWNFSFSEGDKISVINTRVKTYSTFTKPATGNFVSTDAQPSTQTAAWSAYYPQVNASGLVSYYNQAGTAESAALLYALSGIQNNVAAGVTSLSVSMRPQMAVLKIVSKSKDLSISVKNASGQYFHAMKASSGNFVPQFSLQAYNLLRVSQRGTYYVCVPAGQQIEIYNGSTLLKATKAAGLTAGKYYTITVEDPVEALLLPGEFTVSMGLKVRFTKGNLYRDTESSTWHIESSQTSFPTEWDPSHVGHFFFTSTNNVSYSYSLSTPSSASRNDIFLSSNDNPRTIDGVSNKFFNLSVADWTYLFSTRKNAANLFKTNVRVGDKNYCTVVAPDDFTGTLASAYDSVEEVTAAGLLCLPCAGYRTKGVVYTYPAVSFEDYPSVISNRYWTQSPDNSNASSGQYLMGAATFASLSRSTGLPLRLAVYSSSL